MKRLKEDILKELEFRILSKHYATGQRLPAERELASEFSVSRPVVHEALLILESRGLVKMRPRHGVVINDFRQKGKLDLLSSLLLHAGEEELNREVLESLYRTRALLESDAALLACEKGSDEDWEELARIIDSDSGASDPVELALRDFQIHHHIARISGNIVYPLLINSLKPVYMEFLKTFYESRGNSGEIRYLQSDLLDALRRGESGKAQELMRELSSYTLG